MRLYVLKHIKREVSEGRNYWLVLTETCRHYGLDVVVLNSTFQDEYPEVHPDGASYRKITFG